MKSVTTNQYILKEDPDTVTKEDGTVLHNHDKDSHPFFFDRGMGMLVMGGAGVLHDDMLGDVYDALGQYAPDEEEQDNYYSAFIGEYESADPNLVTGRIWTDGRVISLWMPTDKKTLEDITYCFDSEYGINTDGYQLDMSNKTVSLDDFLYGEEEQTPEFTHPEVHTMTAWEKWTSPQLTGARETANKAKTEKLGSTPEAKYNFYRRYGMGDGVQRNGQLLSETPDSVYFDNELDLSYEDDDAYPFVYDLETKHLFIAGEGCTHEWIENEIEEYLSQSTDWYDTDRKKVYDFIDRVLSRKTDSSVIGRLWCDHKVISFWKMPATQSALKETIDALSRAFWSDIWAYNVELDTGIIPLESLMGKDKTEETHFDLNTIHNLPAKEKWNTPQLKGARATRDSSMAQKLGNTSQAEYNFYRRYGMGDSVQRNGQALTESPDHVYGTIDGEPIENSFHDYESKAFVYDIQTKKFYVGSERSQHAHLFDWIVDEVWDDNPDWDEDDVEDYVKDLLARNSDTGISGRVWFDNKVVSFWNMPSINVLRDMANDCDFDLEDYYADEEDDADMRTVGQILKNAETHKTNFDLDTIHNMSAVEKHNTPQLRWARETADKVKAEKLGSTPEAEYNFYRRYGMGDSITRKGALLKEDPDTVDFRDGSELYFDAPYAYPFIYDSHDDIFFLGEESEAHTDMFDAVKETLIVNRPDEDEKDIEWEASNMTENRDEASYWYGRIWTQEKVISFWNDPPHKDAIRIFDELKRRFGSLDGYVIDRGDWGMPIETYLSNDEKIKRETDFDLFKIHLMRAEKKRNTPQIKGARDSRDNLKAQNLGNTPEAEYNFYRRYGMGDNKETDNTKQINEVDAQNISLQSFVPQDELNPRFWIKGKLNSNVRIKLLQIAHNFMDESKVNWVEPEDVVLTGSIANYNWSKYSDVDVHIILDYNKVWKKTEFVEDYFGDKKELWSNTHPNLKIYGFPVEVYVEDLNAPADSSGIFSLLTNEWLKEPVDFNDSSINGEYVKSYAARIETKIDNIIAKMKKERNARKIEDYSKALQAIFDKLKNIRKEGLKKGGEMGSGNIIWKICKRMGYIDKLWDYVNLAYDRVHSIV